jgi:hypothetical protein
MALNTWVDRIDGVDVQTADDINMVAHAVIEAEEEIAKLNQNSTASKEYVDQSIQKAIYDSWGAEY